MAESSDNGAWFGAGLGLGVVIGGLFMWAIIKSQQSQTTPALQSMNLHTRPPPINVYPVIREEAVHPNAPELPRVIEAPGVQSHPEVASTTTYKNNEKWVVERGDDGFIKSLNVVRDAKVNAPA